MFERVFIIDEDIKVREFLYGIISEVGYNVLTLPGGKAALQRLKQERPGLIIIDDAQGDYTGIFLAKKIRQLDKEVKIVMLGQDPQKDALSTQLKETDISAYLKKDFQDPEVLKSIISFLKEKAVVDSASDKKWGSVLIVDDEPDCRKMVSSFLSRRGFVVDSASSGEECLEKIKLGNFNIVLLDITMSGMDGLLTLKRILEINNQIKVVMVSAIQNADALAQAKEIGASDYIVKPFNLDILESSLISISLSQEKDSK